LITEKLEEIWKGRIGYLFIAPLLAYIGIFVFFPVGYTLMLSFMRYEFLRPSRNAFVGFANYIEWACDPEVWHSFKITFYFLAMYIPSHVIYGLVLALLLFKVTKRKMSTLYRCLLYIPVVLPLPIVAYAWKWMYDPSWGVINHLLIDILHIPWKYTGWLTDSRVALPAIALMSFWQYSGWIMILFLVGLNNIPSSLYEAAKIDGANAWQSFTRITLPLLKPIFFVILIMRLAVLGITVQPLIMTEGGPEKATMTYGLYAYFLAFRWGNWRMGYASAWYMMLAILATVLGIIGWRFLKTEAA